MTIKIKLILQNVFGVLLLICSIPMFAEGGRGIIGAIILITGGLICVPKTRRIIEQKYKFHFSKSVKYTAVIFAWLAIGIFSKPKPFSTTKQNSVNNLYRTSNTINETNLPTDTFIEANVHVDQNKIPEVKSVEIKEETSKSNSNISFASSSSSTTKKKSSKSKNLKKNKSGYGNSHTSGRSGYTRGPRGGCYYINSSGRKVYVDRSYCN